MVGLRQIWASARWAQETKWQEGDIHWFTGLNERQEGGGHQEAPKIRSHMILPRKAAVTNFKRVMGPHWGESPVPGQGLHQVDAHGHPAVGEGLGTPAWGAERKMPSRDQGLGLCSPGYRLPSGTVCMTSG